MFNFSTDTIDSIMSDFTVKVAALQAISVRKQQDAEIYQTMAQVAMELHDKCKAESFRAAKVASKIEARIG